MTPVKFQVFFVCVHLVGAQINLGSFNLGRGNNGDLLLGFGQGGSLFGFGGDRGLQVTLGPGRFGANSNSGVSLGNDRLGVDSTFGIDENRGINLGSFLNSGPQNRPGNQRTPGGELGQLLQSLMSSFSPTRRPFEPSPQIEGIENSRPIRPVQSGFKWPTPPTPVQSGFTWPTPPTPIQTTTQTLFPTLINSWSTVPGDGDSESEWGSGFMPLGVIDGHGVGEKRKPVTTEGRSGPITSQSRVEKSGMNSGESAKRGDKKSRFGPPAPTGLIDIDSKEEFKRRI
ncbi:hypothetical protein M3Y97_01008400 [Aphelenchoides bicaudatus]|nr:hypothetical protein M3Y97_01008400 [Aphelenchoides bicaudatus]